MKPIIEYITMFISVVWNFLKFLAAPLKVVCLHKVSFFLWMSFTIFGGLIGIVISVVRYAFFGDCSIVQAVYIESMNGSFYTYSIAIVASVLSGVFIIFAEKKDLNFRRYQIPFITISIFLMFFGGVFYALAKQTGTLPMDTIPPTSSITIEWKQCTVFVMSVLFSVYSFCVCRLDDHEAVFANISDTRDKNTPPTMIPEIQQEPLAVGSIIKPELLMTLYQSFHRYLAKNNIGIESGSNEHLLVFKQDKLYYAYMYDENKPYYFRLILPNIAKYDGRYDAELNKYALRLSTDYMVAKLIVVDDKIWGAFEQIILGPDTNNDDIYKVGIRILSKIYQDIKTFVSNQNMVTSEGIIGQISCAQKIAGRFLIKNIPKRWRGGINILQTEKHGNAVRESMKRYQGNNETLEEVGWLKYDVRCMM